MEYQPIRLPAKLLGRFIKLQAGIATTPPREALLPTMAHHGPPPLGFPSVEQQIATKHEVKGLLQLLGSTSWWFLKPTWEPRVGIFYG